MSKLAITLIRVGNHFGSHIFCGRSGNLSAFGGSNGILYRFSAMEIGRVEEVENTINVLVAQTGRLGRQPGILLQACAITEA
jgi:hypothetical protein